MIQELLELQEKIDAARVDYVYYIPKVTFFKTGNLYDLTFYGEGLDEHKGIKAEDFENSEEDGEMDYPFCAFLDFVIEHAYKIVSLTFNSPDEGANGTQDWDFTRIINSDVIFENLKTFYVQLTDVGDHNSQTIGYYEEDGRVAKLVRKMPNLEELTIPVAPNSDFFEIENLKINYLKLQGVPHQDFIKNLAQSTNLKKLEVLDYTDHFDFFGKEPDEMFTNFEDYKLLFHSKTINLSFFKLRECRLSKEQLFELQNIKPNLQFLYIYTKVGQYVSHLKEGIAK